MGYIKEPDGVDFVIQSRPLTNIERKEISEFISKDKLKNKNSINKPINRRHQHAKLEI